MTLRTQIFSYIFSISRLTKDIFLNLWTGPFYPRLVVHQVYEMGYRSLPILILIASSIGMIFSLQIGLTLQKYGLKMYTPRLLSTSMFRELAPVLGAIVLAGKVGSGIAAEISSMKLSQQMDAMRALGASPLKRIIIPRVLGAMIAIPVLTLFFCAGAYIFGGIISDLFLNVDFEIYTTRFFNRLWMADFILGLIKATVFAYVIGITSCHFGLSISDKNNGVGEATTSAMVFSSVMIVLSDLIMTACFFMIFY